MIRIEIEVETNDPALRDYVLGDIESWRRTAAKVSVSLREEDAWTGGAKTVHVSAATSMSTGAVSEQITEEEEPAPPRRIPPPQLVTVEASRQMVNFPVYVVPPLATNAAPEAMVQPGGTDIPPSV